MTNTNTDWIIRDDIKTLDEAVNFVLTQISLDQAMQLRALEEWELPDLHYSLGAEVRRMVKMWNNHELVEDIGADNPDDAGAVLVWSVWEKLRDVRV